MNLKNDPALIQQYEDHHKAIWPEIIKSIKDSGIVTMEIYRYETRLFMLMEVADSFNFERKAAADSNNSKVQEWESLMWNYQEALPGVAEGEKWIVMSKIFKL